MTWKYNSATMLRTFAAVLALLDPPTAADKVSLLVLVTLLCMLWFTHFILHCENPLVSSVSCYFTCRQHTEMNLMRFCGFRRYKSTKQTEVNSLCRASIAPVTPQNNNQAVSRTCMASIQEQSQNAQQFASVRPLLPRLCLQVCIWIRGTDGAPSARPRGPDWCHCLGTLTFAVIPTADITNSHINLAQLDVACLG